MKSALLKRASRIVPNPAADRDSPETARIRAESAQERPFKAKYICPRRTFKAVTTLQAGERRRADAFTIRGNVQKAVSAKPAVGRMSGPVDRISFEGKPVALLQSGCPKMMNRNRMKILREWNDLLSRIQHDAAMKRGAKRLG